MTGASSSRFQRNAPRRIVGSVMSQKRAVSAPSSTTRCQPCVLPALGAREARSTSSSSSPAVDRAGVERPRHPPPTHDVGELGHVVGVVYVRAPSLTRSSAIVQP